jgi:DNA-binding Lrp family transcriptional regulator
VVATQPGTPPELSIKPCADMQSSSASTLPIEQQLINLAAMNLSASEIASAIGISLQEVSEILGRSERAIAKLQTEALISPERRFRIDLNAVYDAHMSIIMNEECSPSARIKAIDMVYDRLFGPTAKVQSALGGSNTIRDLIEALDSAGIGLKEKASLSARGITANEKASIPEIIEAQVVKDPMREWMEKNIWGAEVSPMEKGADK